MSDSRPVIRAILFDVTGTLIGLQEPVGVVYSRLAEEHGVKLPAWRLEDAFQRIVERAPERVFPDAADQGMREEKERAWWRQTFRGTFLAADSTVRFDDFDALFAKAFDHYAKTEAWILLPGAREVLSKLAGEGVAMGVVSNFDHRLPNLLEAMDLAGFFDSIVTPARLGHAKPDPEVFACALADLGALAAQAVFVGDNAERDIQAAMQAGLLAVEIAKDCGLADLPAHLRTIAKLAPAPA